MARSDYSQLLLKHLFATYTPFTTNPKLTHFVCFHSFCNIPPPRPGGWGKGQRDDGESPGGQRGGMLQATVRMSCI